MVKTFFRDISYRASKAGEFLDNCEVGLYCEALLGLIKEMDDAAKNGIEDKTLREKIQREYDEFGFL